MTTGKFTLVIRWPSGQSTICGEMTDHQHGEICRILSPDYRAQLPSQGGEAVAVVGVRISTDGFGSYIADSAMGIGAAMPGEVREQLMTVAQHSRIMAAASAKQGEAVVWRCKRLERGEWVYDYSRHKACVYCEPLYTHPADQVADSVPGSMRSLLLQIADNKDASYFIGDLQAKLRTLLEVNP